MPRGRRGDRERRLHRVPRRAPRGGPRGAAAREPRVRGEPAVLSAVGPGRVGLAGARGARCAGRCRRRRFAEAAVVLEEMGRASALALRSIRRARRRGRWPCEPSVGARRAPPGDRRPRRRRGGGGSARRRRGRRADESRSCSSGNRDGSGLRDQALRARCAGADRLLLFARDATPPSWWSRRSRRRRACGSSSSAGARTGHARSVGRRGLGADRDGTPSSASPPTRRPCWRAAYGPGAAGDGVRQPGHRRGDAGGDGRLCRRARAVRAPDRLVPGRAARVRRHARPGLRVPGTGGAAVRSIAGGEEPGVSRAVSMAKSTRVPWPSTSSGKAMQLHGGIGYTWESGVHAFLKRAVLNRSLFGSPAHHRRRWRRRYLPAASGED